MGKDQEKQSGCCGRNIRLSTHLLLLVTRCITNKEEAGDKRLTRSKSVKGVSAFIAGTQWPDGCPRKYRSCGEQQ